MGDSHENACYDSNPHETTFIPKNDMGLALPLIINCMCLIKHFIRHIDILIIEFRLYYLIDCRFSV